MDVSLADGRRIPGPEAGLGRNLTYGLLDLLGKRIVTGAYETTGFPTEAELSEQQGVSRSVTREAVKMLTAKGLLTARPRQGTSVQPSACWNLFDPDVLRWMLERKVTAQLLEQFNQLRNAIEPGAAALAARTGDPAGLAGIQAAFSRMEAAEAGQETYAHHEALEADIGFHLSILRASGNPFFMQFRDVVATALRTSIRMTRNISGKVFDLAAHEAVMQAILRGDADGAFAAMSAIIGEVSRIMEQEKAA